MKSNKKLKFTFLIIKREFNGKVLELLKKEGFETSFSFYGKGSASVKILDYLGIGETENNVVIFPTSEEDSIKIMDCVKSSDYLKHIIAFRVPVSGISSMSTLNHFLKEEI
jgi:hypothetical protein